MIPLIKHTFTHPITHSEIVALAMRHWPMPCVIEIKDPAFDNLILTEFLRYGMDFGPGSETIEEAVEISPNGSFEILCSLRHPVLPCTLPIEMKGIAV